MYLISRITLLVLVLAALAAQSVHSADADQLDIVLGKNGSIVKGKIIGRVEGKYITVQMQDGKQITIRFSQIAEIMKGDADYEARHTQILDSLKLRERQSPTAMTTIAHADLSVGADDTSSAIGLTGAVALLTKSGVSVGFGGGWDQHEGNQFLPVFGELAYYFTEDKWTPYLRLQMGYSIGWRKDSGKSDFGGFRMSFGFGMQRTVSEKLSLTGQISYNQQSAGGEVVGNVPYYKWISGSLGIVF